MSQWAGRFRCLFLGIVMVSGSFLSQASVIESPQNTTKLGLEYVGTQTCAECHQQEVTGQHVGEQSDHQGEGPHDERRHELDGHDKK